MPYLLFEYYSLCPTGQEYRVKIKHWQVKTLPPDEIMSSDGYLLEKISILC
jgi:hypothetical protein